MTPRLGTDGKRIVYPVRGIVQGFLGHPQRTTLAYVAVLVVAAVATTVALIALGYRLEAPVVVLTLAVVAAAAESIGVSLQVDERGQTKTAEQSISVVPTLLAAVLFGPLAAAVVGGASMLGDRELFPRGESGRSPRLKWAAYTSTRFIGGAAMGLAAQAVIPLVPSEFGALVASTLVAAVVGEALDVFFVALTASVRGRPFGDAAKIQVPASLVAAPIYSPIVAVLALMYLKVSPWTLVLFLIPAMAAQRLYGLYQEQRQLASDLSVANRTLEVANVQLEEANLQFASLLVAALDARDEYTAGHSEAVAIYARDIAARMDLPDETQEQAYLCGLVHDIGKIGLPPGLLEKPGALTLEERREMEKHSAIGESILREIKNEKYRQFPRIVRHHHERIDGEGYPDRLRAEDIPLVSRIIAVADAYNAMTSKRPYRDAMPSRVARHRLAQAVDSQFDTAVVAAFEAILAGASEDYRLARSNEFQRFADSPYVTAPESPDSIADVA